MSYLAEHENESVALNVTGGTKLMAVAAQEAFRMCQKPVLYVNVETDEVIVLGQSSPSPPLRAQLKVRDLLESQACTVVLPPQPQVSAAQRDLLARVIDLVGSDGPGLGALNRLAATHDAKQLQPVDVDVDAAIRASFDRVTGHFSDGGQLSIRGGKLTFPNHAARDFVNGGWLEYHAFKVLKDLQGQDARITDVVMNLQVTHPDGTTRNEIDVAFLFRNTLHLIECKTANLGNTGAGGDERGTEAIYKMEALLKLGGLRTKGMLVDYRGSITTGSANWRRADSAGIKIVAGRHLRDFSGYLRQHWLQR
jgi:hypothetical protein